MTTLKITALENKTAYITGMVVVVEPCTVTLVGMAQYISDPNQLRLRLRVNRVDVARFPDAEGDVWTADGADATCVLNTNTVQALAAFSGCQCNGARECTVLVEKITTPKALYCSSVINLRNWPQVVGADVPYNLATWPDDLDAAQEAISDLESAYEIHDHDGTDSPKVDHANLLNAGTLTHAVLESSITALENGLTGAEESIDTLQTDVTAAGIALSLHNHNGTGSEILSHAGLSGIGTRTHDQLEADTHAVDVKAIALAASYNAHAHTGADGTAKVALANVDGWAAILARLEAAEAAVVTLTNDLAALDAAAVKKQTTLYTVTAPEFGTYRNINENMTGDQLARSIPTIVADLAAAGVL